MSSTDRPISEYEPVAPKRRTRRAAGGDDANWSSPPTARGAGELAYGAKASAAPPEEVSGVSSHAETAEVSLARRRQSSPATKHASLARPGHALTFACLFLFTSVLYFRPYEYLPVPTNLAFWLAIVTLAIFFPTQFGLEGTLTARPPEVKFALLLLAGALLSIPLAINPSDGIEAFTDPFAKAIVMFIVFVNVVRTKTRLKLMLLLAFAISCVLSASALADFWQGNLSVEGYRVAGRIGGMFGNPNDMALHLVTMVPLALALLLASRNFGRKLIFGALALLFTSAIVVTYSRGGFLGLSCALFVMAWKTGRRHRVAVCILALFALVTLFALAPGNYAERVGSIIGFGADRVGSAAQRQQLLWRSLYTAVRHPLFGVGIGNFHIVSLNEQVSHNAYTQVAAEMGMPTLLAYVLLIIVPLRSLRRIERETFDARRRTRTFYLAVGVQAALVGYMVSSFFASVAYQWYVYYLVGYAVALRRVHESGQAWASNLKAATNAADADVDGRADASAAEFDGAGALSSI